MRGISVMGLIVFPSLVNLCVHCVFCLFNDKTNRLKCESEWRKHNEKEDEEGEKEEEKEKRKKERGGLSMGTFRNGILSCITAGVWTIKWCCFSRRSTDGH